MVDGSLRGDINTARTTRTADKLLDLADAKALVEAAGKSVSGKWSPYPQEIEAKGVMSFAYTELTPKKIADDMNTERDQKVLTGFKTHNEVDRRTGKTVSWEEPQYETKKMKGTGNIRTRYDEVSHPEVTALASAADGHAK